MIKQSKQNLELLALSVVLLLSALAAKADQDGDFTYTVNSSTHYATITRYTGWGGAVTVPSSVGLYIPVNTIGSYAFAGISSLTNVTIGNNITSIGDYAFQNCTGLPAITIPNSVASIGSYVFASCTNLNNVTIPNSVTSIGDRAFGLCSSLINITIPTSITNIGDGTFDSCSSLTSVTIPDSVVNIKIQAFYGCSSLTNVTIGGSVTSIGNQAFQGCRSLTNITIPNSVISLGDSLCYGLSRLTSVTIGNHVTSIGMYVFNGCTSLSNITIPNSVTNIGIQAFSFCTSLTNATIGNSVTGIGNFAFYDCTNLISVTIPNSVTSVGRWAFGSCTSLLSVSIPNSVTTIGDYAFIDCSSLNNIRIPNSSTSIGDYAFSGCTGLITVTIPNSVTNTGSYTFAACSNLTSVICEGNAPIAGTNVFINSNYATVYYFPETTGWGPIFADRPTAMNVQIITSSPLPPGTTLTVYNQTLAASGGVTPYAWSIVSGGLPLGLNLSSAGAITGTPSMATNATFTVQVAGNDGLSSTKVLSVTITGPLTITASSTLPSGVIGATYNQPLTAIGGTTPYTWSMASGGLPFGLSLSNSGAITGTPSMATNASFTVQVADNNGLSATQALSLTVTGPPTITTVSPLPAGVTGTAYNQTLTASDGVTPYTWSIVSGGLPSGLELSSTGAITGTPDVMTNASFTVQVIGGNGLSTTKALSLAIMGPPTISTASPLPSGATGTAYSQSLAASGGVAPYTWSIASGGLPLGLELSSAGAITGTPSMATNATFTVRVAGNDGLASTQAFSLTVTAPPTISTASPLPAGVTATAYNQTLVASGGVTPYTWSIASGALPDGLSLSSAGGIAGTPTSATNASFTVQVVGGNGLSATKALSVTITGPPTITMASPLASGIVGTVYSQSLAATGSTTPYTWSIFSGNLPPGLTLSSGGVISGTPGVVTNASFTVQVIGGNGLSATKVLSLAVVMAPLVISTASPLLAGVAGGYYYYQTLTASGGVTPYTWAIASGGLPIGLSLSSSGVISGTPSMATNASFTVLVTDSNSLYSTKAFSLAILSGLPPQLWGPAIEGSNFICYITSKPGNTCRVEAKTQLTDPAWSLVGTWVSPGYGVYGIVIDPATNSTRLYRAYDQTTEVSSTTVVGYLNITFAAGSNWVVIPFSSDTNTLGAIIPNKVAGAEVFLWENSAWRGYLYRRIRPSVWVWWDEANGVNASTHPLPPAGTGFILLSGAPFTLTLTGEMPLNTIEPPMITSEPESRTNLAGTTATFTVAATGAPPLSYQWRHNSTDMSNAGIVSGAFTNTLTLLGVSAVDAGLYSVVITNSASSVTSSTVALTVVSAATVTFSGSLSQTYDGTAKSVSVTTLPVGLAVSVTYNGSPNAPTNVGSYTLIGTINDASYVGSATNTLAVVIPDNSTNVTAAQSATLAAGQSSTASTSPTAPGQAGLSVTATNGGGGDLLVVVATYATQPASVPAFQAGASYMDIRVWGADGNDSLSASFYYPSTITGSAEASLALDYWDGANWSVVRSSGGSLPARDTTDNLDGTVSGGRFNVLLGPDSTPALTGLTGTVFALAPIIVASEPPRLTASLVQSNRTFQFGFTSTPGAAFRAYSTTNLTAPFSNWTLLGILTDSPPGQFQFTDSQATNARQRFYQVRSP
ncbi:MAG: leucine-rich repeat protein [Verrucomicrobia bacterium]|nr:leucine-rich repeat protein [Verrucomicrobiota bacterium]